MRDSSLRWIKHLGGYALWLKYHRLLAHVFVMLVAQWTEPWLWIHLRSLLFRVESFVIYWVLFRQGLCLAMQMLDWSLLLILKVHEWIVQAISFSHIILTCDICIQILLWVFNQYLSTIMDLVLLIIYVPLFLVRAFRKTVIFWGVSWPLMRQVWFWELNASIHLRSGSRRLQLFRSKTFVISHVRHKLWE